MPGGGRHSLPVVAAGPDAPAPPPGDGEVSRWRPSRRDLLKYAGAAGLVVALPAGFLEACQTGTPAGGGGVGQSLTATQRQTLESVVDRLLPSDESGPGAKEAMVGRYIARSLAQDNKELAPLYAVNLGALDKYAKAQHQKAFTALTVDQQDAVLADVEAGRATGFTPSSAVFFQTVWEHTLEGMFGDPYHGGNHNFIGWDLVSYPGVKLYTAASDQNLDVTVAPAHASVTSLGMFKLDIKD
jgi:gluconate 2-dehydrogenase gamma chain